MSQSLSWDEGDCFEVCSGMFQDNKTLLCSALWRVECGFRNSTIGSWDTMNYCSPSPSSCEETKGLRNMEVNKRSKT